jgi:hypothetical protein
MIARSHPWLVTDFYQSSVSGGPVILYNSERAERTDVHVFAYHPRTDDTDVKCDLHPRWSRDERFIAVDTCEAGFRQVRILDVNDMLR